MAEPADIRWQTQSLWQRLRPLLPGISVEVIASLPSTNSALIDRARASVGQADLVVTTPGELDRLGPSNGLGKTPHGRRAADTQACLLVAEEQTQGRGRQGRLWHSTPGASLTFSLALPFAPVDWSGLSLAVGIALAEALEPGAMASAPALSPTRQAALNAAEQAPVDAAAQGAPRIGLKWPNDLWLAGSTPQKLGGVLIETVPVGERRMCIVGVGLNIAPQSLADLSSGYACLQQLHPGISAPAALALVAEPLVRALLRFEQAGFLPFASAYAARDLLRGQQVSTTLPALPQGQAQGVDSDGALLVVDGAGRLHRIVGGEVSVSVVPAAGGA